ncbi:Transmembrane protein 25 [Collichthys lucidus]|uniref:Transmembrane protein 25 n=1 Tax=Collichthys lucidus TaxID=240159 RepID=A0A4V6AQP6_COLLU|nr:Transmembrane protein 25 [Collichthys lucidus]
MGRVCLRRWASGSAVVFLHTLALSWTGAVEPAPKIDGRHRAAVTLQENATHRFNCQSDGWDPNAPPLLTWYLNGERQRETSPNRGRLVMTSQDDSKVMRPELNLNSTFSLRAKKWDRELVCVASNPRTGESYNATITLNVQFQPEILRVNAHYSETSDPGLSLVLFALVRSNPPAIITFVDQYGQLVANTSDFLILDSRSYPWLSNHTLKVMLSSLSGNVSLNVSNSVGTVQSNLTLAEFLQSRVEVPMLGIVTGGAMAFMALLILSLIVLCLMQKNKTKSFAREAAPQNSVGERKKEEEEEEDLSLAYAARETEKITVKTISDEILVSCGKDKNVTGEKGIIKDGRLEYKDASTGEYTCGQQTIYVKIRKCDNCVEFDATSIAGLAVGNVLATIVIGVAVYLIASQNRISPNTSHKNLKIDHRIGVKTVSDGIVLSCGKNKIKSKDGELVDVLKLEYKDENTGEYRCVRETTTDDEENDGEGQEEEEEEEEEELPKIFVKFRKCENCIDLDLTSILGIVVGNVVATIVIGVAVYLIASQNRTSPTTTHKSSDRRPLVSNEGPSRAASDHYQPLKHRGQRDTYDVPANNQ